MDTESLKLIIDSIIGTEVNQTKSGFIYSIALPVIEYYLAFDPELSDQSIKAIFEKIASSTIYCEECLNSGYTIIDCNNCEGGQDVCTECSGTGVKQNICNLDDPCYYNIEDEKYYKDASCDTCHNTGMVDGENCEECIPCLFCKNTGINCDYCSHGIMKVSDCSQDHAVCIFCENTGINISGSQCSCVVIKDILHGLVQYDCPNCAGNGFRYCELCFTQGYFKDPCTNCVKSGSDKVILHDGKELQNVDQCDNDDCNGFGYSNEHPSDCLNCDNTLLNYHSNECACGGTCSCDDTRKKLEQALEDEKTTLNMYYRWIKETEIRIELLEKLLSR